ncbi:hypothetical protein [Micropruina sp.]|uniref:hypothetical protein n=1 Tax=Micropruina sp. TaxID=2737536 RepID=UPI0039E6CB91
MTTLAAQLASIHLVAPLAMNCAPFVLKERNLDRPQVLAATHGASQNEEARA